MVKDRSQCENCQFSYWAYSKEKRCKKFFWCNHLDYTGEPHVVIDGVCQSKKTKRDGIINKPKNVLW